MPELPDLTAYLEAIAERAVGERLERLRLVSPFVLRSVDPPVGALVGKTVRGLRRLGKRIVIELDDAHFVVATQAGMREPDAAIGRRMHAKRLAINLHLEFDIEPEL